ncbi:MAG: efflux RND transporter permease subunit [Gammaproteobacteria bacterium]|nr:efflux RND transporter permease subunit [Gammaproteobacteria bacterium]
MQKRFRTGGLAAWSIRRPVSVIMLTLAVMMLGLFALQRLGIDLLPHIIYPEVRVRIRDPGVPSQIMEDKVTRQLEEQLAITENAISVQSTTNEGESSVDLSFPYGTDIDIALRDASTRLDRAKRFLPDTIDPPVIYKRDPMQIPVLEFVVSSNTRDPVELRNWVDYEFSRWFLNLPGVASTEVGGGLEKEIHIIVDQERLASLGHSFQELAELLAVENQETPGGRMNTGGREYTIRTSGRFQTVEDLATLPLWFGTSTNKKDIIRLRDVARVVATHEDERLKVRLNGRPGVKMSVQKQPSANTVAVVDTVKAQMDWLREQKLIPGDVQVVAVGDQSIFVRHALNNASTAALSGAILAMLVVYLFLGNFRRTLVIGTAIPIAIMVTFILMSMAGLTLNIMTLGGLALGVGMLVDNTIVMLENITRHQREGEAPAEASVHAAAEVNSAIVASTSTNLAAILPFLFIGGLTGLLFSELIFTLTAAIVASLIVAITLVPTLGARITDQNSQPKPFELKIRNKVDSNITRLQTRYSGFLHKQLSHPWRLLMIFIPILVLSLPLFLFGKQIFLPKMDEGQIRISVAGDPGLQLSEMDHTVTRLEKLFRQSPELVTVFSSVGGRIFGRSEYQSSHYSRMEIQLKPGTDSEAWIKRMNKSIAKLSLVGFKVRMRVTGVRGFNMSRGDDDISIRVQGPELASLTLIGDQIVDRLEDLKGLRNLTHSYEDAREEINVVIDRARAADLGVRVNDIGKAMQVALEGLVVSEFIDGDRQYDIRLRLPLQQANTHEALKNTFVGLYQGRVIRLRDVAKIEMVLSPANIKRDRQRRIVEVSASLQEASDLTGIVKEINHRLADLQLPEGYTLYDGGTLDNLKEGQKTGSLLLALALFLVFVVMAVQYESLRNPVVIMLGVPFGLIGVAIGLLVFDITLSMPVWLGLIMLAGIVVNNAIVLVEQIEIEREKNIELVEAIITAARLRLRPILMTTLTTAIGMSPLALGIGSGAEMLQPLAIVLVCGLLFSMLVTLLLIPMIYYLMQPKQSPRQEAPVTNEDSNLYVLSAKQQKQVND